MATEQARIGVHLLKGVETNLDNAVRHIRSTVDEAAAADMIQKVQELGGGVYESFAYGLGLLDDKTPSAAYRESTHEMIQNYLVTFLDNIYDELASLIDDTGAEPGMVLRYDPREWFDNEPKRVGDYVSGRLFCLARTGTLQAMGFFVEGTGLEDVANYPLDN